MASCAAQGGWNKRRRRGRRKKLVSGPPFRLDVCQPPTGFLSLGNPDRSLPKPLGTAEDLGTSEHPQGTRRAAATCPASPCPSPGPAGPAAPAPSCIKWRRRRQRRRVASWAQAVPSMPGG